MSMLYTRLFPLISLHILLKLWCNIGLSLAHKYSRNGGNKHITAILIAALILYLSDVVFLFWGFNWQSRCSTTLWKSALMSNLYHGLHYFFFFYTNYWLSSESFSDNRIYVPFLNGKQQTYMWCRNVVPVQHVLKELRVWGM